MRTDTNKPLYKIVVDETLYKLSMGALKVGHRFPPEADFAADLGVSRHTVRKAFFHLENAGVIKRRKRGGTEVIAVKPLQHLDLQFNGFNYASGMLDEALLDLSDISRVDHEAHSDLCQYECESSGWVCFTGTRTLRDQTTPFVRTRVFVSDQFSNINVQVGDSLVTIYQLINERYGESVYRMKQRYSAQLCPDEVRNTLGLNHGAPVLNLVLEMFNDEGDLIELVDSLIDPTRSISTTDVVLADNL